MLCDMFLLGAAQKTKKKIQARQQEILKKKHLLIPFLVLISSAVLAWLLFLLSLEGSKLQFILFIAVSAKPGTDVNYFALLIG